MMKPSLALLALGVLGLGGVVAACTVTSTTNNNGDDGGLDGTTGGDDGGTQGTDASDSGTTPETGVDAPADGALDGAPDGDAAIEAEAEAPMASVRFASWSPDAPAAGFDFCVRIHATSTWTGPLLGVNLADAGTIGDGGTNALPFPQVTAYLSLPPGTYDAEVVSAGSTDCTSHVVATATTLPALAANALATFAAVGDVSQSGSDPAIKVVGLLDDSTPASGAALLRFVNAAPDLVAVDMGTGTLGASSFQALFTNVQFGQAGTAAGSDAGTVDSNGYLNLAALSAARLSVHTSAGGTSDTATASNVTVAAGAIDTVALVNGKNGGAAPQFLLCQDNPTVVGLLSACSIVSP